MKRFFAICSIITILLCLCGCQEVNNPFSDSSKDESDADYEIRKVYYTDIFDTVFSFFAYTSSDEEFSKLSSDIHDYLTEYHQLYDIYNTYDGVNNIKTINDAAGKNSVVVDERIISLLEYCKEMTEFSGGILDPTYGRLMSVWHQYYEMATAEEDAIIAVPNDSTLEYNATYHGWNYVDIDRNNHTVYITDKDVRLNVGAIAKGYAVECAAKWLEEKGISSAAINMGGNVRAVGGKEDMNHPWVIGIADPKAFDEEGYLMSVNIADCSVVTSGDYQRFYEADGHRFCHIIDLKSLYPANTFHSVTVITKDSGFADALSTSLFLMNLDEGKKMIESLDGVEALWVLQDYSIVKSSGFQSYICEE